MCTIFYPKAWILCLYVTKFWSISIIYPEVQWVLTPTLKALKDSNLGKHPQNHSKSQNPLKNTP